METYQKLQDIISLLRQGESGFRNALARFDLLPRDIKMDIYISLVKIAFSNTLNQYQCAANAFCRLGPSDVPHSQRIEAIEDYVSAWAPPTCVEYKQLMECINLLNRGKVEEERKLFSELPEKIQEAVRAKRSWWLEETPKERINAIAIVIQELYSTKSN